jgi:hypothetical protein
MRVEVGHFQHLLNHAVSYSILYVETQGRLARRASGFGFSIGRLVDTAGWPGKR